MRINKITNMTNTTNEFLASLETNTMEAGNFMKIVAGLNKFRILSSPVFFVDSFTDKQTGEVKLTKKYKCDVIDRTDNQVKKVKLSATTARTIGEMSKVGMTKFSSFPMPYDILLTKTGTGLDTRYAVNCDEKVELSPELMAKWEIKKGVTYANKVDTLATVKGFNMDGSISDEDIPF